MEQLETQVGLLLEHILILILLGAEGGDADRVTSLEPRQIYMIRSEPTTPLSVLLAVTDPALFIQEGTEGG